MSITSHFCIPTLSLVLSREVSLLNSCAHAHHMTMGWLGLLPAVGPLLGHAACQPCVVGLLHLDGQWALWALCLPVAWWALVGLVVGLFSARLYAVAAIPPSAIDP